MLTSAGGLTEHIKSIGLFRQKDQNVLKLASFWWMTMTSSPTAVRRCIAAGVGRQDGECVLNMWCSIRPSVDTPYLSRWATAP